MPPSTPLSRSRPVLRTAGMGHFHPYAASSAIGCRAPNPDLYAAARERASFELCGRFGSGREISRAARTSPPSVPLCQPMRFRAKLTGSSNTSLFLLSKGKLGEPSMATPQVKTVRKSAPAARSNPAAKTAGKPTATPAVQKLAATKASNQKGPRRLLLSPLR
jgi:hypothetical protein